MTGPRTTPPGTLLPVERCGNNGVTCVRRDCPWPEGHCVEKIAAETSCACEGLHLIPGPDPGACPECGGWVKAGMPHDCESHRKEQQQFADEMAEVWEDIHGA